MKPLDIIDIGKDFITDYPYRLVLSVDDKGIITNYIISDNKEELEDIVKQIKNVCQSPNVKP